MRPRKLSVAYEETQSNRVSDFRNFVSLFPKTKKVRENPFFTFILLFVALWFILRGDWF